MVQNLEKPDPDCAKRPHITRLSSTIWSVEDILCNNSRPRILPVMEFGMGSQVSQ